MTDNHPAPLGMREKQLIACVRQGRMLEISVLDEEQLFGYLAGMDDDTYLILQPTSTRGVDKILLPKTHILWIQMHEERTFRDEMLHDEMEPIVTPFLNWINKTYPPKSEQ